jgi:hypothetical protein
MTEPEQSVRVKILLPMQDPGRNRELVARIVEALRADPATRASLEVGGTEATPPTGYVTLAALSGGAPPAGVPYFNEDIGVLSVPAPSDNGVGAVLSALGELATNVDVEPEQFMRTQ